MFEGISFLHSETNQPVTSRQVSDATLKSGKYDPENLANSEFYIFGSTDAFRPVPITDFAKENLFYMQAFTIFHYRKGSYTRRQNFHSFLVLYTLEGTGSVEYCGKNLTLNPGDGMLINCCKPHYYEAVEDWKVAVLHVQGPLAAHYSEEYEKMGQLLFHEETTGRFARYLEQVLEIYDSPSLHLDLRASHAIDGLLLYLVVLASKLAIQKQDVPRSVQQAMKYLEERYQEAISLDDLAKLTRINKYHLSKEFKRYTGFSPNDYLIWVRRISESHCYLIAVRVKNFEACTGIRNVFTAFCVHLNNLDIAFKVCVVNKIAVGLTVLSNEHIKVFHKLTTFPACGLMNGIYAVRHILCLTKTVFITDNHISFIFLC